MNFWDSSAIVALIVDEPHGSLARRALEEDPRMAIWWGTPVECVSAIARHERRERLGTARLGEWLARFEKLGLDWHEVQPDAHVRSLAQRLVRVHPLKAADALQLAAALVLAEHEPGRIGFMSFDARLNDAAAREGFSVLGSQAGVA